MALFAGLKAGPGRQPEGKRRHRAVQTDAVRGERPSREKVNALRRAQLPEIAGLAGHPLSNMTNKPLKAHGGWCSTVIARRHLVRRGRPETGTAFAAVGSIPPAVRHCHRRAAGCRMRSLTVRACR